MSPRAREDIVRPRLQSGARGRPLNFTVDAMTRRRMAALTAVLTSTAFAGPWHAYDGNVELQKMVSVEAYKRIDFLTPSPLPEPQRSPNCIVTYDVRPAFTRERHWCLQQTGSSYTLDSWESPAGTDVKEPEHRTVSLPADVAKMVRDIWLNAILEAHYPRFLLQGADGDTHYFGAMRDDSRLLLRAEAWSPEADFPPRCWLTPVPSCSPTLKLHLTIPPSFVWRSMRCEIACSDTTRSMVGIDCV